MVNTISSREGKTPLEFYGIQYLRGIAAMMVIFHHAANQSKFMKLEFAAAGVDIFFVISGFIMWQTTANRDPSPFNFLEKRIIRVVPLYWIATLVTYAAHQIDGDLVFMWDDSLRNLIRSLMFYPPNMGELFQTALVQGWTLCFEMFFYAIFFASLFIKSTRRRGLALIGALPLILSLRFVHFSPFFTNIIIEFWIGMAISAALSNRTSPRWVGALVILSGVVALFALNELAIDRVLRWGVPSSLIVAGAILLERSIPLVPTMKRIGDASYSIYIWHLIAFNIVTVLTSALMLSPATIFLLNAAAALLLGMCLHTLIEKPLTIRLRKHFNLRLPLIFRRGQA